MKPGPGGAGTPLAWWGTGVGGPAVEKILAGRCRGVVLLAAGGRPSGARLVGSLVRLLGGPAVRRGLRFSRAAPAGQMNERLALGPARWVFPIGLSPLVGWS